MLAHVYNIIIDRGVGAPVHIREVDDGQNALDKKNISILITTVQLHGASGYDKQMSMHTSTVNKDIILVREFKKHLLDPSRKNCVMGQVKYRKQDSQLKWTKSEYHV